MKQNPWPYLITGLPQNPKVVFLHGFLGTGEDWLPVAQHISDKFRVVLPDLPGHGKNISLQVTQPLNFDVIYQGFENLLNNLGFDQVNLVGYSMGGRIALHSAIQNPSRFNSLVLESANPGILDDKDRINRIVLDQKRAESIRTSGMESFIEKWYELELFRSLKQNPKLFDTIKAKRKKNDPIWASKIIYELSPGLHPPLWKSLKSLRMPVLVITGERDQKYTSIAQKIAKKLPKAEIKINSDAGHNVHSEKPEWFATVLQSFFQGIS